MQINPIATIYTPYRQKFAIPRQPGLVSGALGRIEFAKDYDDINCLRGIEQFSHLWLIFHFHQTADKGWSPMVRPPRLGGNQKQGVFATRSTFRPNSLGMSVVQFESVQQIKGRTVLNVRGIDLLNGTPIIDIKPYVPYADAIINAQGGMAQSAPENKLNVRFSSMAERQLTQSERNYKDLRLLICQVLAQDPRPAYQDEQDRIYGMNLYIFNIRWQVGADGVAEVIEITTGKE